MDVIALLGRRAVIAVCIVLSACAAAPPARTVDTGAAYGAFLAARFADAQQDPVTATHYYEMALRADPSNQALVNEGFIAAILAGSSQAAALAGQVNGDALAVMLLGNQAAVRGDFSGAETKFVSLAPDGLAGLIRPLLVAWTQAGSGNDRAALAGLTPNFLNQSYGPVYVLNAALIADLANDQQDAAQFYGDVGDAEPNLRLVQVLASWQARQGQSAAAQAELAQLAAAHPELAIALPALTAHVNQRVIGSATDGLAEAYLTLAGSLDQPSQVLLRTTFLQFALMLRPDLSAARLLLATVQAQSGPGPSAAVQPAQLVAALATLQPIGADDVLFAPAALQRAQLLATLGRNGEAVALLERIAKANPGNPYPLQAAGDVLRETGQYAQAIVYYDRAIAAAGEAQPGAWSLYFDRGIAEDQLGDWSHAEPDLQTALKLSPNQPYALNYLGYSWALRGEKLPQAAAMLQQATGLDPNDGAVIDSLGFVKLRQGQTAAAVSLLTQAVELVPTDAEVNAHLGDAFKQAGMDLQANYQWRRALSLQPDPKLKAEILAKLRQVATPHAG